MFISSCMWRSMHTHLYWWFEKCSALRSANTPWAQVVASLVFSGTSGKLLRRFESPKSSKILPRAWTHMTRKGFLLNSLNFMNFADLLRVCKGGPLFRSIWHKWISLDFGPKSIFSPKGAGKWSPAHDFWCFGKISYYILTTTTLFSHSESEAKKLMGGDSDVKVPRETRT